jgi:hypothetical protein
MRILFGGKISTNASDHFIGHLEKNGQDIFSMNASLGTTQLEIGMELFTA